MTKGANWQKYQRHWNVKDITSAYRAKSTNWQKFQWVKSAKTVNLGQSVKNVKVSTVHTVLEVPFFVVENLDLPTKREFGKNFQTLTFCCVTRNIWNNFRDLHLMFQQGMPKPGWMDTPDSPGSDPKFKVSHFITVFVPHLCTTHPICRLERGIAGTDASPCTRWDWLDSTFASSERVLTIFGFLTWFWGRMLDGYKIAKLDKVNYADSAFLAALAALYLTLVTDSVPL